MDKRVRNSVVDTHTRSIAKAVSWRIWASLTTSVIVFSFTKELALSIGVGLAEAAVKLMLYYFHERLWEKLSFGKKVYKDNYHI